MRRHLPLATLALSSFLICCSQGGREVVQAVVDKTNIGAGESASPSAEPVQPPPQRSAAPPASSAAPDPTSSTEPSNKSAFMCLMWQVCDCNEGCVGVNVPTTPPPVGTPVTVSVGARAGQSAFIATAKDKKGHDVLIVTSQDPAAPHMCRSGGDANALGYLCETSKSGPVPVDACRRGCGGN